MRRLSLSHYHRLAALDRPTCYRLTAVSRAAGILRNYRRERLKTKMPYADKLALTECYGFPTFGRLLRIPYRQGE